jgi:hypothetical protein
LVKLDEKGQKKNAAIGSHEEKKRYVRDKRRLNIKK